MCLFHNIFSEDENMDALPSQPHMNNVEYLS